MSEASNDKKRVRRVVLIALAVILVVAGLVEAAFKTSLFLGDLSGLATGSPEAGRATLAGVQDAHGGLAAWRSRAWVEFELAGTVPLGSVRASFGVDAEDVTLRLRFDPCDRSEMTIAVKSGTVEFEGPVTAASEPHRFLAASIRHLFEMPFAMHTADIVHAAPDGEEGPRVFLTWGATEASMTIDQYVLEAGGQGTLVGFHSTVRRVAPFLEADVNYGPPIAFDGFLLPGAADVRAALVDMTVHDWTLTAARAGPPRPASDACGP